MLRSNNRFLVQQVQQRGALPWLWNLRLWNQRKRRT